MSFCTVEPISDRYIGSLIKSKVALIYGGYNSILDVLALGRPALVVLRATRDREQQEHLEILIRAVGRRLTAVLENECSVEQLHTLLIDRMKVDIDPFALPVNLGGAEKAARTLAALL